MIDRREWIKTCIAAASAALLDTSGLPVVQSCGPNSDNDSAWAEELEEESSVDNRKMCEHYGLTYKQVMALTCEQYWILARALP